MSNLVFNLNTFPETDELTDVTVLPNFVTVAILMIGIHF